MNRGSTGRRFRAEHETQRFNEAPIHESGKSWKTRSCTDWTDTRFNEAPIHESGKCLLVLVHESLDAMLQ